MRETQYLHLTGSDLLWLIFLTTVQKKSHGCTVCIGTSYELNDRGLKNLSPDWFKNSYFSKAENTAVEIRCTDHTTPSIRKKRH
jgi:hypothetical protein